MTDTKKFQSEVIELPSKGYFYPKESELSKGEIELKHMTAKEEDILMSQNLIRKGIVLDKVLQALIISPINYEELLIGDKNAILVASRILAYGKDYTVSLPCPRCGESNTTTVDLAALETKEVNTDQFTEGSAITEVELPTSKVTVQIKLLTHADEQFISREIEGYKKMKTGVDPEITTRLKRLIISVDGNGDKGTINAFVNQLPSRDSLFLRQFLRDNMPDINLEFDFECTDCNHVETVPIPMGTEFFWPAGRR